MVYEASDAISLFMFVSFGNDGWIASKIRKSGCWENFCCHVFLSFSSLSYTPLLTPMHIFAHGYGIARKKNEEREMFGESIQDITLN
jgi:hypothetical protein